MKLPPVIVVQLIHILGPMKGEIQEFSEEVITIGRKPSCQLHFPADATSISRKHAEIIREGNKFKLIDHSANGTFVNGKGVKETYLKNGDVLEFAKGGPKVSFLTQMKEGQAGAESAPPLPTREEPQISLNQEPLMAHREPKKPEEISVQKINVPLIIQYGPTLRSFRELPVTIGENPKCDFRLDHPAILDQQAQIFFSQNQYWIRDLTGQGSVQVNRQPVVSQVPLRANDELALSLQGPFFRFLGEGRLAEVTEPPVEEPKSAREKENKAAQRNLPESKTFKGLLSKFKKYWDPDSH